MLQGIETVNNYTNINTNKNTDYAKMMVNANSDGVIVASQDTVSQKIKKVERSDKNEELKNQNKDRLLEFLERKVGRGEALSHDENLYVMGKKSSLYEQSINIQKIRDRIIQRISNKKSDETMEDIYKELTEQLKKEYGMEQSSAELNNSAAQSVSYEQSEEYIRMTNALQNNFVEVVATYEEADVDVEVDMDLSDENVENSDEIKLFGSGNESEDKKTDFEKEVEAKRLEEAMGAARKKLDGRMFSKINSTI